MRVCKHCGSSIEHRNSQALYCDAVCKARYNCKQYYQTHKQEIAQKSAKRFANLSQEQYQKYLDDFKSRYQKTKGSGKWSAKRAKRHTDTLLRTPKWLTEWDLFYINEIYALSTLRSKTTGVPHEVDHIIPLQGKLVSGLHVANNLQILTRTENRQKRNEHFT